MTAWLRLVKLHMSRPQDWQKCTTPRTGTHILLFYSIRALKAIFTTSLTQCTLSVTAVYLIKKRATFVLPNSSEIVMTEKVEEFETPSSCAFEQ